MFNMRRFIYLLTCLLGLPGCISDIVFGYSDLQLGKLVSEYKQQVDREIVTHRQVPTKIVLKSEIKKPACPRAKLTLGLKNAVCLATTGNLLPGTSQSQLLLERKEYYQFNDILTNERLPPGNREFLNRSEDLRRLALSLRNAQHEWNPQLSGTLSFIYNNNRTSPGAHIDTIEGDAAVGVEQRLPFGGSASLDLELQRSHDYQNSTRDAELNFSGGPGRTKRR